MRPTFTKSGFNYLPVIVHSDGKREVLYGDPLVNGITATKYAALEITARNEAALNRLRIIAAYHKAAGRT